MEPDILDSILQKSPEIAQIASLIYLILKLEDKRSQAIKARDEAYKHVLELLATIIDELLSCHNPDKVSQKQLQYVQEFLATMKNPPPK